MDAQVYLVCAYVLLCVSMHVWKHASGSEYCTHIFTIYYNAWHLKK